MLRSFAVIVMMHCAFAMSPFQLKKYQVQLEDLSPMYIWQNFCIKLGKVFSLLVAFANHSLSLYSTLASRHAA